MVAHPFPAVHVLLSMYERPEGLIHEF